MAGTQRRDVFASSGLWTELDAFVALAGSSPFSAVRRRDRRGRKAAFRGFARGEREPAKKNRKSSKSLLTHPGGPAYIRLTNDGGHAAGDKELRLRVSRKLDEIKRAA